MSNFDIQPQEVENVAENMVAATRQLQTSLENLSVYVNQFVAQNAGEASVAYTDAQLQWNQGQAEMTASLNGGVNRLIEIVEAYQRGDRSGAGIFGGR